MSDMLLIKTPSEQRLEWFKTLTRPLTDGESDDLYRAMHAVYVTAKARADRQEKRASRIEREWGWRV